MCIYIYICISGSIVARRGTPKIGKALSSRVGTKFLALLLAQRCCNVGGAAVGAAQTMPQGPPALSREMDAMCFDPL